jgi:ferredoxin
MPYYVTDECDLCGACVAGCENDAITEGETKSHININLCIECGTCVPLRRLFSLMTLNMQK